MKNVKNDTADCKVKIIPLGGLEQIGMNILSVKGISVWTVFFM